MSDYFIPLNHSTPIQKKWQPGQHPLQRFRNHRNHGQNSYRRSAPYNICKNSSRSSFTSKSNNNSYVLESSSNIDEYLHPSMLQDPWESLRQASQRNSGNTSMEH